MSTLFRTNVSETDILDKSTLINRTILRTWAVFSAIVQVIHIIAMAAFSGLRMSMVQDRIYFGFYIALFLYSIFFLVVDIKRKMTTRLRHGFYMVTSSIFLFWYTFYNIYDIMISGPGAKFACISMMTAYAIFSAMLAFKPIYALSNMILSYLIFVLYLRSIPMLGAVWSFSFSAVLCVAIYLARYKDILFEISQIKIVDDIKFKWLNIPKNLSPEQYELIREKAGYITFEWDIQKDCIYFSKEINDYFDYPATIAPFADFVDKLELISDDQKVLLYECMDNVKKGVNFQKRDLHFPVKTGEERWFEARIITQKDNRNEPLLGIGILADVTEVRERITLLEKESRMDLFTGLYNRASIEHYGDRKLQELEQEEVLGMMIMDVDDFKNINDQYGHPVGDYVLKKMADLMRQKAPKGARVGRLGGDEFIVLYVTKDIEEFCDYAKEVLSEIASIKWQDREIKPQCSIGLSAASCNECSYAQLYERADKALYDAKNNGKNQLKCDLSEKLLHQRQ